MKLKIYDAIYSNWIGCEQKISGPKCDIFLPKIGSQFYSKKKYFLAFLFYQIYAKPIGSIADNVVFQSAYSIAQRSIQRAEKNSSCLFFM